MSTNSHGRVHDRLRRATASDHRALDHHPLLQRLTGSDLTRELYAESLAAMHRAHARLEWGVLESGHHLGSGLKLSARLGLLEADLCELGWSVPPGVSHSPTDPLEGRPAWWGRAYVLEGSRLGGAVIAGRVRSSVGDAVPCRFFGEGIDAGDRTAVLAMLECELDRRDKIEEAIEGARAAFAAYKVELDAFDCGSVT